MTTAPLRIGISACFFHADPTRAIFKGKTLQYMEQSFANWVMGEDALAIMLPRPAGGIDAPMLIESVDGLLLAGGSDVAPISYGEEPLDPNWQGDRERDLYELELLLSCIRAKKPVLGICRGLQLINVALGGTLYQDLKTQLPESIEHRNWGVYDALEHEVQFEEGARMKGFYPDCKGGRVNSVHHQAIKDLAPDLVVEARSTKDGLIEAIRMEKSSYLYGVQWHPEFMPASRTDLLDPAPILRDFLAAAKAAH